MTKINLEDFLTLDIKYKPKKFNPKSKSELNNLSLNIANIIHDHLYDPYDPEPLDGDETEYIANRILHHLDQLNANL